MVKKERYFVFLMNKLFVFFSALLFFFFSDARSANALIYQGQVYNGWVFGGFGFGNIQSFYYAYPGWIDFFIFFMIFILLAKMSLGNRFQDESRNAGKALSLVLGIALALGMVLWEANNGIYLFEHLAGVAFFMLALLLFWAVYSKLKEKQISNIVAIIAGIVVTIVLFFIVSSGIGLGPARLMEYMFAGFSFNGDGMWITIALIVMGLVLLFSVIGAPVKNFFRERGSGFRDTLSGGGNFLRGGLGGAGDFVEKSVGGIAKGVGGGLGSLIGNSARGIGAGIKMATGGSKKDFLQIIQQLMGRGQSANSRLRELNAQVLAFKNFLGYNRSSTAFFSPERMNEFSGFCDGVAAGLLQIARSVVNNDVKMSDLISRVNDFESLFSSTLKKIKNSTYTDLNYHDYLKVPKQPLKNIELVGGKVIYDLESIRKNAEILRNNFGDLSLNEILRILNQPVREEIIENKKAVDMQQQERQQENESEKMQRRRSLNDLKQKYIAYVNVMFQSYSKDIDKEKFKRYMVRVYTALQKIITLAERKGCEKRIFLSNAIAGKNMLAPEDYWYKLAEKYENKL